MATFRFRLAPVLRQREIEERDEQVRVAEIERQRIDAESRLRAMQARIQAEEAALAEIAGAGASDPRALKSQSVALISARTEAQKLAVALASVLKRLSVARRALAQKTAARRAMELLRDRRLDEFRRAEDRRESGVLDDLASSAAARREQETTP